MPRPRGGPAPILPPARANTKAGVALPGPLDVLLSDRAGEPLIALVPRCLSAAECDAWIEWGEADGFALERHAQTRDIAHRDIGRLAISSQDVAAAIWARLSGLVPARVCDRRAVGCNPDIRLYKYERGQRFGPHVDESKRLGGGARTEYTVLLYLNDEGLDGGETVFYRAHGGREQLRVKPRAGCALVHAHGARCLTHEGAEVSSGVKYLLRTDVAYA